MRIMKQITVAALCMFLLPVTISRATTQYNVDTLYDVTFGDYYTDSAQYLSDFLYAGEPAIPNHPADEDWEGILKFDLSPYADGSIGGCTLYMYCHEANSGGCRVAAHEVTTDTNNWDEFTNIPTWNYVYTHGLLAYASSYADMNVVVSGGWVQWNLATAVNSHEDGYFSVYIKADYETVSGQYAKFFTKDYENSNYRPYLTIDYTPPPVEQDDCGTAEVNGYFLDRLGNGFLEGNMFDAIDDYSPMNDCTGYPAFGKDIVFYLDLQSNDNVEILYTQLDYDASVYLLTDCSDMNSCVAGADNTLAGDAEQLNFTAETPGRYYLILDCWETNGGGEWTMEYNNYSTVSSVDDVEHPPRESGLVSLYPNPFNPTTTIEFELVGKQHVSICVYDLVGRCVSVLLDEEIQGGKHELQWNGRDPSGKAVPSGTYVLRLETDSGVEARKVSLVR